MSVHAAQREFAVEVVRQLAGAGFAALWAGGCVRDLLMGRDPDDYDVATSATPEQVRHLFGRRRTLAVGESFGVIIVLGQGVQVEVATFRTEGPYADGRRPDSVRFATPEEDAQRRDFTINGMFFDPLSEQVLDFVGGEQDLHDGVLRAIGDPAARMTEDKLRMLRAVRFAATLDFELETATAHAIQLLADEILVVSWERITQELRKLLVHRRRRRGVRLAQQLGLLSRVFPELAHLLEDAENPEWTHTLNVLDALASPRFPVALATLLHTVPAPSGAAQRKEGTAGTVGAICRRLRLSNSDKQDTVWLVQHQHDILHAPGLPVAKLKRLLAEPLREDLLVLTRAFVQGGNRDDGPLRFVEKYLATTPQLEIDPPPLITGDDLLQAGLTAGPGFKELLEAIRDAQLSGQVTTHEAALELALRRARGDAPSPE